MSMTRKHFEAIADAVMSTRINSAESEQAILDKVACELAIVLRDFNPSFNRQKFLSACGVTE